MERYVCNLCMYKLFMYVTKRKMLIWNVYILYDSNYVTFRRSQTIEAINRSMASRAWQGWGWQKDNESEHRGLLVWWKYSGNVIIMDTGHYTFVQIPRMYRPRVNLKANYGLWVTMMSRFNCNKCIILVGVLVAGEAMHVWWWGILYFLSILL